MDIEKIRIKTTLKVGKKVWEKGKVLTKPFPSEIRTEIRAGGDTFEILERTAPPQQPPVSNEPEPEPSPEMESEAAPETKKTTTDEWKTIVSTVAKMEAGQFKNYVSNLNLEGAPGWVKGRITATGRKLFGDDWSL